MRAISAYILVLGGFTPTLGAQTRSLDVSYGAWRADTVVRVSSAGFTTRLAGPLGVSVALVHLDDRASAVDRTQTGGELSLGLGRDGSGFYALGAAAALLNHRGGNLDLGWSGGAGVSARLLPFLSLGIEGRYRAEDQFGHGFWHLDPSDRAGWMLTGRLSILLSHDSRRDGRRGNFPPSETVERAARRGGLERSELAAHIVATALDAMGTPYQWGGDDGNGYDCSGLIQFAYGEQGIELPRISREQARSGREVTARVDRLAPGDILGFSVQGDGVTHVGLYVGNGRFIHSASGGVRLSSLIDTDPDSLWWQHRWVAARRVLD